MATKAADGVTILIGAFTTPKQNPGNLNAEVGVVAL
jgi:hypothetical protein